MFSGKHVEPSRSVMTVLTIKAKPQNILHFELECAGISVGAYQILLKMLFQSHYPDQSLLHLEVRMADTSEALFNLEQVINSELPEHFQPLPFNLAIPQPLESNSNPVVRLQFCKALSDEEFEYISQCIFIWDKLIAFGGFYESFEPLEVSYVEYELYLVSPDTVEHPCEGSVDEPIAYDALINMAVYMHVSFCPILILEID